jgi:hypothetical protein
VSTALSLCSSCKAMVRADKLERHKQSRCTGRLVPCLYCNARVRPDFKRTHLKTCAGVIAAKRALQKAKRALQKAEKEARRFMRGRGRNWKRSGGTMSGTNSRHRCSYVTIMNGARY